MSLEDSLAGFTTNRGSLASGRTPAAGAAPAACLRAPQSRPVSTAVLGGGSGGGGSGSPHSGSGAVPVCSAATDLINTQRAPEDVSLPLEILRTLLITGVMRPPILIVRDFGFSCYRASHNALQCLYTNSKSNSCFMVLRGANATGRRRHHSAALLAYLK